MQGSVKWSLWIAVVLLTAACGIGENGTIPRALYTTWQTDDQRYAGCYLEITERLLVFHGKDGGLDINHIGSIKIMKGDPVQFHIHYKSKEDQPYTLKVLLDQSTVPPQLRFVTPKTLAWTPRRPHGH